MNILKFIFQKGNRDIQQKRNYNVNIIIPKSGWILTKIGERTAKNCKMKNIRIKSSDKSNLNADVNFYCDIQNTYFGEKTKLDIGYMTHADRDSEKWLFQMFRQKRVFENLDGIVLMNERYKKMCQKVGFPKEKLITITPGQTYDTFSLKKTIIGIVSRGGYPGYGQDFMEELFSKYDLSGFKFRFLGNGWDGILPVAEAKNIEIDLLPDADYSIYPKFYHEIDYLLIPGLWTAGPMSFQESLACGIPVISADVGFASYEFQPDFIFPPDNTECLYKILQLIRRPIIKRRKQVENMSWESYAVKLVTFFKKIEKLQYSSNI